MGRHEHRIEKSIQDMILNQEYCNEEKIKLMELKRYLEAGNTSPSDEWVHARFITFFSKYAHQIARWLGQPSTVIVQKIKEEDFTEVELSLIITNLFIEDIEDLFNEE